MTEYYIHTHEKEDAIARILDQKLREHWNENEQEQNQQQLQKILAFMPHQDYYYWDELIKVLKLYFDNPGDFEGAARELVDSMTTEETNPDKVKEFNDNKLMVVRYILLVHTAVN